MRRAAGELTVSHLRDSVITRSAWNAPIRLEPKAVVVINGSLDTVWVDPRGWHEIQSIVGMRAPAAKPAVAVRLARFVAIFAAGAAAALLVRLQPSDDYMLRIMLPSPVLVPLGARTSPPVVRVSGAHMPARPALRPLPPVTISPSLPDRAVASTLADTPSHPALAIADLAAVGGAIDLVIKTDIAQPWQSSGLNGYVVPGPIKFAGVGACRIVAVWTEAKGLPGRSTAMSYCLTSSGAWVPSARTAPPEAAITDIAGGFAH